MFNPKSLVGEVLDRRYRLVRFLGDGAFGWVYAAEELVGGEAIGTCALKVLRPKNLEQGRSVLMEFAAAARLAHPGLVQFRGAFDVQGGAYEGALCLAMELGEGTLRDDLRAGRRLAPEETLGVARDLAEVLAWLHAQGAVHRDVKPENLLRVGQRWKLGDLGLVRAVEGTLEQTATPRGTPRYLAPEAMRSLVGPSVDVWGLGVVVQECLTGVLAYDATSEAALYGALLTQEPTIAQNLPAPFDAVVRGCLVKDPRRRWTAEQVVEALKGTRARVAAPVPEPARQAAPPMQRKVPPKSSPPQPQVVAAAPRDLVALGRNAQGRERFQVEGGGPVLVSLPAGRFVMGSPAGEEGREREETQHEVVLSRGFLLGEAPVTQAEYAAVVGTNPSLFQDQDGPVEWVSWFDAVSFCNALSRRVGLEAAYVVNGNAVTWRGPSCPGFRLPTEAEWEYACRAGTTGVRHGNLDAVAWYDGNSGGSTHPVRQKRPNPWGLHDTLGNVWEWCWDWHCGYPPGVAADPLGPGSGSTRVARGGAWSNDAQCARAAYRGYGDPGGRGGFLGFRLARSLP